MARKKGEGEMRVNCLANKDKAQANMVEHTISTRASGASPNTRICSSCLCASSCVHVQSTAYNISSIYIYIYIYNEHCDKKKNSD